MFRKEETFPQLTIFLWAWKIASSDFKENQYISLYFFKSSYEWICQDYGGDREIKSMCLCVSDAWITVVAL